MKFFDWITSKESNFLAIYAFLLFFLLTPGVIITLPPKGSRYVVALVHALIFALIWKLTSHLIWRVAKNNE